MSKLRDSFGVNLGRSIATNGDILSWLYESDALFPNYFGDDLFHTAYSPISPSPSWVAEGVWCACVVGKVSRLTVMTTNAGAGREVGCAH